MQVKVISRDLVARDTLRVEFAAVDGRPLPAFEPGAHLELNIAGMTRQYSICSLSAERETYDICVLRTPDGRGGSAYVHDQLAVGDQIEMSGPFNAFPLIADDQHVAFIAGGIGITPFISMIERLEHERRSFELHYAVRTPDRFLPVLARALPVHRYSEGAAVDRMDIDMILNGLPEGSHVYVCGPQGLMEAVRTKVAARGWPDSRLHMESFGGRKTSGDQAVEVRLAHSGITLKAEPGTSLLDTLLQNDVWASYECRRGECASCVATVLSGEVDHRDICLTDNQRQTMMCPCVSWPTSDVVELDL
jgi:vanillate O-demethylase ferredoxin subunit